MLFFIIQTERSDMLDTIRQLSRTVKLKDVIIGSFIPEDSAKGVERRAVWSQEEDCWTVQKLVWLSSWLYYKFYIPYLVSLSFHLSLSHTHRHFLSVSCFPPSLSLSLTLSHTHTLSLCFYLSPCLPLSLPLTHFFFSLSLSLSSCLSLSLSPSLSPSFTLFLSLFCQSVGAIW